MGNILNDSTSFIKRLENCDKNFNALSNLYADFCATYSLKLIAAMEQDFEVMTEDQKTFLNNFIDVWESVEE